MNHYRRFSRTFTVLALCALALPAAVGLAVYILTRDILAMRVLQALGLSLGAAAVAMLAGYAVLRSLALAPIEKLWQAVWHVSPGNLRVPPPNTQDLHVGQEMISGLVHQIYEFASYVPASVAQEGAARLSAVQPKNLLSQLPVGVIVLDKQRVITQVNLAVSDLLSIPAENLIGKSVYDVVHLSFHNDSTLDSWLTEVVGQRATAHQLWERVRIDIDDPKAQKQIDLAASYSKDNSDGNEIMLVLFDHTKSYDREDASYGYVALAVHELRTPLTVLRGYIEVFEDELGAQMNPELREFMRKMDAATETLTAFVSNILNVARVDENQLVLSLHEANWNDVLSEIINDLGLRAGVRGKTIELDLQPDLPPAAIDKISMYEVISNLVDNAIKYSGESSKIVVHTKRGQDGTIETVVQDFGIGIPHSALDGLFTKFYRSHRSKNAVSGSGLGLYLVKAIINAHGGNVWVQSKEGEGSSFGFSLQPYSTVAKEGVTNYGIERQVSGWIKNHSLYRR